MIDVAESGIFREETTGGRQMARARTNSKRNTPKNVAPALGVAGLSLAMAGGASASTAGSAMDVPVQNTATHHDLFLGEGRNFRRQFVDILRLRQGKHFNISGWI